MSTAMEWSHDYCLSCDRQITEGAYCSQACRLADLEKAGAASEPNSPCYLSSSATSTASYASSSSAGFRLPPALNFAAYKPATTTTSTTTSSSTHSESYASYFTQHSPTSYTGYSPAEDAERPQRVLSPSSSRSSLSSISNYQQSQGMSPQAATALRGYVSSFDQVRDTKRRLHRQG